MTHGVKMKTIRVDVRPVQEDDSSHILTLEESCRSASPRKVSAQRNSKFLTNKGCSRRASGRKRKKRGSKTKLHRTPAKKNASSAEKNGAVVETGKNSRIDKKSILCVEKVKSPVMDQDKTCLDQEREFENLVDQFKTEQQLISEVINETHATTPSPTTPSPTTPSPTTPSPTIPSPTSCDKDRVATGASNLESGDHTRGVAGGEKKKKKRKKKRKKKEKDAVPNQEAKAEPKVEPKAADENPIESEAALADAAADGDNNQQNANSGRRLPCVFGAISAWWQRRKERRRARKRKAIETRTPTPAKPLVEYEHKQARGGIAFTIEVDNRPMTKQVLPPIKQREEPIKSEIDGKLNRAQAKRSEELEKKKKSSVEQDSRKTKCQDRKAESELRFKKKVDENLKQKQAGAKKMRDNLLEERRCGTPLLRAPSTLPPLRIVKVKPFQAADQNGSHSAGSLEYYLDEDM